MFSEFVSDENLLIEQLIDKVVDFIGNFEVYDPKISTLSPRRTLLAGAFLHLAIGESGNTHLKFEVL